jgi:hypothetical protein
VEKAIMEMRDKKPAGDDVPGMYCWEKTVSE